METLSAQVMVGVHRQGGDSKWTLALIQVYSPHTHITLMVLFLGIRQGLYISIFLEFDIVKPHSVLSFT